MIAGLEPAVAWAFAVMAGLLAAVTVVLRMVVRGHPTIDYADLMQRAVGWWIVLAAFLTAFLLGPWGILGLFALVSLIAYRELVALSPVPVAPSLVAAGYVAVAVQYALVAFGPWWAPWGFLPVVMGLALPALAVASGRSEALVRQVAAVQLALMFGVFSLSLLVVLAWLPQARAAAGGPGLIVFVIALAQANDIAQYYWGKLGGKTPIVPALSPKKTWGGFLGGIVTVAGLAWLMAPPFTPLPQGWAVLTGVAIAIAGLLGDLTISALKREAGVKDAGKLLPGFGGVMDRFDSLIYVAPLFLALFVWVAA